MRLLKPLEITIQWLFALFMATLCFVISAMVLMFIGLKLCGIPIGTVPAAPAPDILHPILFAAFIYGSISLSLLSFGYVGAVTVPKSQRKIGGIIFPAAAFLLTSNTLLLDHGVTDALLHLSPRAVWMALAIVAGCAPVTLFFCLAVPTKKTTP